MSTSKRALWYAITRPRILTLAAIGSGLLFWGAPPMAAAILFAVATIKAVRILSFDDIDERLRLRDEKKKHGIERNLSAGEQKEILAIDHYCHLLREGGIGDGLARETLSEAFAIVRSAGRQDSAARLQIFRHGLPVLRQPEIAAKQEANGVANRIERELHLLHAARKEVEAIA